MSTNSLWIGVTALVSFSTSCVVAYYLFVRTDPYGVPELSSSSEKK